MFATTHILSGIIIGQHAPNAWWAFGISLISHYALDFIPHGDAPLGPWMVSDPKKRRLIYVLGADACISALMLAYFWANGKLPALSLLIPAILGALLPDLFWFIYFFFSQSNFLKNKFPKLFSIFKRIDEFHHFIHSLVDKKIKKIWPGITVQLIIVTIFVYLIFSWR